eukprot:2877569-Pyramimonas_sp.AAC.1
MSPLRPHSIPALGGSRLPLSIPIWPLGGVDTPLQRPFCALGVQMPPPVREAYGRRESCLGVAPPLPPPPKFLIKAS